MRTFVAIAICALSILPSSVFAQDANPGSGVSELTDVIVEARRLEEAAKAFLEDVNAPPTGAHTARWNTDLCISVSNVQPRAAQFMIDRIARTAIESGADVAGPGCRPNVVIVATNDGDETAERLVEEAGYGFSPAVSGTNLGRDALRRFRTSGAPVRWWHVALPVLAENGQLANGLRGDTPPTVVIHQGSRLVSDIRYDLALAIVVVDLSKTSDVSLGLLSDYAAMVVLSQVDPQADTSEHATILNVFSEPGVTGFSDWDRDYMSALYKSPSDRATARQQRQGIVSALANQRRQRQAQEPATLSGGDTD